MIEPQSAQDGESAETENATFVPPPNSSGCGGFRLALPFVCPLAWPF
jgi:hypothetical protein